MMIDPPRADARVTIRTIFAATAVAIATLAAASPAAAEPPTPTPTPGATAQCCDGAWSHSQHRSGTCSHHGGVCQWCPCDSALGMGQAHAETQRAVPDRLVVNEAK